MPCGCTLPLTSVFRSLDDGRPGDNGAFNALGADAEQALRAAARSGFKLYL